MFHLVPFYKELKYIVHILRFFILIILFIILLLTIVYMIENNVPPRHALLVSSISITILLGLSGYLIHDTLSKMINAVENRSNTYITRNDEDTYDGTIAIITFIDKQTHLFPLYIFILLFVFLLCYFILYTVVSSFVSRVFQSDKINDMTNVFSKVMFATVISLLLVVPVHFVTLKTFRYLKGNPKTIKDAKYEDDMFKIITSFIIWIVILYIIFKENTFFEYELLLPTTESKSKSKSKTEQIEYDGSFKTVYKQASNTFSDISLSSSVIIVGIMFFISFINKFTNDLN